MKWETFKRRRRIVISEWFNRRDIKNYEDLLKVLLPIGVQPPTESSISDYFVKKKAKTLRDQGVSGKRYKDEMMEEIKSKASAHHEEPEKIINDEGLKELNQTLFNDVKNLDIKEIETLHEESIADQETNENYSSYTVKELKEIAKGRNISTAGLRKQEIIETLEG